MALPDINMLSECLSPMLGEDAASIEITSRKQFTGSSTFPVELVTCKTRNNAVVTLFCKYVSTVPQQYADHRNGIAYEAKTYTHIVDKIPLPKIRFYGQKQLPDTGEQLLVLEFLGDALTINRSCDSDVLQKAAEWIASFHSLQTSEAPAFLKRYNKGYYISWLARFEKLFASYISDHPYVAQLVDFFKNNLGLLLSEPQTIIHGEYYPGNILIKDGCIYPVDWESAAIGPGEIDLASLIEGWDHALAENAKLAYVKSRADSYTFSLTEFEKRLLMAQLYLFIRWWPANLNNLSTNSITHLMNDLKVLTKKVYAEDFYTM